MNNHHVHDTAATDGSDAESDDAGDAPYYRPISSYESDDAEELGDTPHVLFNGGDLEHHLNPNPSCLHLHAENGIAALDLDGDRINAGSAEEEQEEEAEARERDASILRAFREDESRRSAPLSQENTVRIVSAMRGISFPDYTPEWAGRVTEDRWLDHLRRLRGEPSPQS